ncbi:MAG: hypothetical protein H0W63_07045 [Gemmatimonadaceae bacterium]|nr:hypothetical protein [Gemmatimonadaceae bacterium]
MASDGTRLLQVGALVIPIILAAAGGKWAVDATRTKMGSAAPLPSAEELESLRAYVSRTPPVAERPSSQQPDYTLGGSDPFAKVTRTEARSVPSASGGFSGPVGPRWVVSTIMLTENRRVAVINSVLANVGTVLPGGARVIAIEPDHVVLMESNGARHEISVQGGAN